MPPFVNPDCPHCGKKNRFDIAELEEKSGTLLRRISLQSVMQPKEYSVTCQHCGKKFKFAEEAGSHGKKK